MIQKGFSSFYETDSFLEVLMIICLNRIASTMVGRGTTQDIESYLVRNFHSDLHRSQKSRTCIEASSISKS